MTIEILADANIDRGEAFLGLPNAITRTPQLGSWYYQNSNLQATIFSSIGTMYAVPLILGAKRTLSGVAMQVSAQQPTTVGNMRAALYEDTGDMMPGALLADFGLVTATTGVKVWAPTQVLLPDIYWITFVCQGGSGSPDYRGSGQQNTEDMTVTQNAALTAAIASGYTQNSVTGALPDPFVMSGSNGAPAPQYAVRFSA